MWSNPNNNFYKDFYYDKEKVNKDEKKENDNE